MTRIHHAVGAALFATAFTLGLGSLAQAQDTMMKSDAMTTHMTKTTKHKMHAKHAHSMKSSRDSMGSRGSKGSMSSMGH